MGNGIGSISVMAAADGLDGRRSCRELLQFYNQMGIPHFQRGLVWESRAVGLLLESLYYETPCGSIILWSPPDADGQGVPLGESGARFLIVDGQQRIRSLHGVFEAGCDDEPSTEIADGDDPDDNEDVGRGNVVWCLNVGRLPEFADTFQGGRRYPLFRLARDPREPNLNGRSQELHGALLHDQEALLPLKWFIENEPTARQLVDLPENRGIAKVVTAVLANEKVSGQLRLMPERPVFAVSILPPLCSHQDVVATFNRINSSGKRVEAEERAFANLVASCDHAEEALRTFFERTSHRPSDGLKRDDLLQRQKESQFGFKLFMRAFMMELAYHANRSVGSASLAFDAADQDTLTKARVHLPPILDQTVALLAEVKQILRDKLYCDDFRMLPETASLWPIFQLLIRFPKIVPAGRDIVAALALRLMLAKTDKRELLDLCARVNKAPNAQEAVAVFDAKGLQSESVAKAIRRGVDEAQSLTDRYVLILYWLLRSRKATDFSYNLNLPAHASKLRERYRSIQEPLLSESAEPQKQHIVPYKRLKVIFNLSGARPGKHPVHDIGNVTYISAGQNDFKTGIGEHPLKLSGESQSNLAAHMLNNAELLTHFSALCPAPGHRGLEEAKAEHEFGQFCKTRRDMISEELIRWESTLRNLTDARVATEADFLPVAPRRISPQVDDRVRALPYASPILQKLVGCCQRGMKPVRNKSVHLALAPRKGRGKHQAIRIDLFADGKMLSLKLSDHGKADEFVARFGEIPVQVRKGSTRCDIPTTNEAEAQRAAEILEWVSNTLGRDG